MSLGKVARSNMMSTIEQLRQSIKDNEKLNSEYNLTVNKTTSAEMELNQQISNLEEQVSELGLARQNDQNRYEEEIFLLEGRIKEKELLVDELVQQL